MTRTERILRHIDRGGRGVEIGPGPSPLCPKRDGWNVLSLDVFDTETLRQRAAADPNIRSTEGIEEVDLVGPAHALADLVEPASLDFVVSSHNLEHLPNPVWFLQSAERSLRVGGVLSMAVPDYRHIFDALRPASTLADLLEAYVNGREQPTRRQAFDFHTLFAADGKNPATCLREAWDSWRKPRDAYEDVHCGMFTPHSLEAILHDLRFLGLVTLDVVEVTKTYSFEFDVHLRKPATVKVDTPDVHYARRARLLHGIR